MDGRPALRIDMEAPGVAVGWVHAEGVENGPSPEELLAEVRRTVGVAVASKDSPESALRKAAARDMLRFGAYKPTGRGKPASEYLLNAAAEGAFPVINTLVDINNLASLESLLPISIVDLDRAGTDHFLVRRGREGEEYVFNPAGQVLALRDLVLLSRMPADAPCATPIKDCQATKTHEGTRRVLGIVYGPQAAAARCRATADRMASLVEAHCGAEVRTGVTECR